jgi:hypothetical protein
MPRFAGFALRFALSDGELDDKFNHRDIRGHAEETELDILCYLSVSSVHSVVKINLLIILRRELL